MIYDVAVAGGGPAGALAATVCASAGLSVIIIEQKRLPRYKACGGGLPAHSAGLLGEEIDSGVVRERVRRTRFIVRDKEVSYSGKTEILMVFRREFDYWLVERARRLGTDLRDATRVTSVTEGRQLVTLETSRGTYRARFCVGTDGGNSIVRRTINNGLNEPLRAQLGFATDVCVPREVWNSEALLEFGIVEKGYGWVFPKGEMLSCGIGTFGGNTKTLVAGTKDFLVRTGLKTDTELEVRGAPLAALTAGIEPEIVSGRILLAGDAAFLIDPLTGEGIYQAMKSGVYAGQTIVRNMDERVPDLSGYRDKIRKEFYEEHRIASQLANFLVRHPRLTYYFGLKSQWMVQRFESILRGETTYSQFIAEVRSRVTRRPVFRLLRMVANIF